jgi:predicted TIM-barrel fold metal-dependent hydrolase
MDAVGVDGAVLVSPFSMYRYDASYALEVYAAHPGRFGLVKPVDPADPAVADTIADWAATDGTVAIRLMINRDGVSTDAADPGLNRVLAAAAQHSLPVNLMCTGRLEQARLLAARNPGTMLVIDHLGLPQPHVPPAPQPFADLRSLALAARQRRGEISGACAVARAFHARHLGSARPHFRCLRFNRCMWGTDWTRRRLYDLAGSSVPCTDRLSDGDRAALMGETLAPVYKWSPSKR